MQSLSSVQDTPQHLCCKEVNERQRIYRNNVELRRILGLHGDDYEDSRLLECGVVSVL
jgi:hypothetical protein